MMPKPNDGFMPDDGFIEDGFTPDTAVASPPQEKTLAGFGSNILSSAGKFAGDIGKAVVSAPGLLYGASKEVGGLGAHALFGRPEPETPVLSGAVEAVKGIPDYLAERYGGPEKILDTLYKDPVGFAADLSTLVSGAGAAAKVGKMGKLSEGLSTASKIVDPIAQAGRAVRAPGAAVGRAFGLPEKLYESALKPSTAGPSGIYKARRNVTTGLREEIPVTAAGETKAKGIIDELKSKVDAEIAAIPAGAEFDPLDAALKAEAQTKPKYVGVTKAADEKAIDKTIDTFLEGHSTPKSPVETQKFKTSSHASLKDRAYGEQKGPGVETEKAITRLAKEKLEEWAPNLKQLNAREGSVIALERDLQKAVDRIRKHQMIGIGTPLMAGAGGALAGPAGAWALAAIKIALDQPAFKSNLAFAIKRAQGLKASKLTKVSTAVRVTEE
jgi:hypothetical protein